MRHQATPVQFGAKARVSLSGLSPRAKALGKSRVSLSGISPRQNLIILMYSFGVNPTITGNIGIIHQFAVSISYRIIKS